MTSTTVSASTTLPKADSERRCLSTKELFAVALSFACFARVDVGCPPELNLILSLLVPTPSLSHATSTEAQDDV